MTTATTIAQQAAATVLARNEINNSRGPLWSHEADALARLFRTRTVRGALATTNNAEQLAEDIHHATRNWSHADLVAATTAAVFQAENRHVRDWLWFSRADMQCELASAVTACLVNEGWSPSDL